MKTGSFIETNTAIGGETFKLEQTTPSVCTLYHGDRGAVLTNEQAAEVRDLIESDNVFALVGELNDYRGE